MKQKESMKMEVRSDFRVLIMKKNLSYTLQTPMDSNSFISMTNKSHYRLEIRLYNKNLSKLLW